MDIVNGLLRVAVGSPKSILCRRCSG